VLKVTAPTLLRQLLELINRVTPLNVSASLLAGVTLPQLAAELQLLSSPPPFHVMLAASPEIVPMALNAMTGSSLMVVLVDREELGPHMKKWIFGSFMGA
jgi:hypothetical protein